MPHIYYDLTELFYAMSSKVKYYGIARTVLEVGFEISKLSPKVRFVIFSPSHDAFFEVQPMLGDLAQNGVMELPLPASSRPGRLRRSRAHGTSLVTQLTQTILQASDRRKWNLIPRDRVSKVNLDGEILVSLSQPRIVSDYVYALKRMGQSPKLFALLHDLIPLHDTKIRKYNTNFLRDNAYLLSSGATIVANSKFTQSEIYHFIDIGTLPSTSQIHVIQLAHEFRSTEPTEDPAPFENYFLCVGTLPGRKNLECVLNALLYLNKEIEDVPSIILAGAYRKRIASLIESHRFSEIKHKIRFAIDPSQEELESLYRNAIATLLPSFIEGWGLPAAESLWLGTPAIVSDIPVLHEVGKELALYFDPTNPSDLSQRMTQVMNNEALRTKITEAKSSLRSWQNVAKDLLTIVEAA